MKKHKAEEPLQVSWREVEILLSLLEGCLSVPGDVVELGCYRGDTSLLMQKMLLAKASEKRLWIYDSFEGLPEKTIEDASAAGEQFCQGELLVTKREVIDRFKRSGMRVPIIKKGFFEDLDPEKDLPSEICFGFLDGDLYKSIKTSLGLCCPRLVEGGILVVHDYNNPELPGVTKAVDEFLRNHNYKLEIRETLAIVRTKN